MYFMCPVCFYGKMTEPPMDYNICECCGTEFGNDDCGVSFGELRKGWMNAGAPWFFGNPPHGWNPWIQLLEANVSDLPYSVPFDFCGSQSFSSSTVYIQHEEPCFAMAG